MKCWIAVLVLATLLCATELVNGHTKNKRAADVVVGVKNATRSAVQITNKEDNFYDLNNKMLPNAKLVRSKRSPRAFPDRPRPRNLSRRRPPFLPPRLPPIGRRRFPKRPGKVKFPPKPPKIGPHPPPGSQYGPPVGFFVMNINNEIVHKSKDLGDIPPQYLDKIIPPNFISDSPHKIYALEHDEGPQLALGESKEVAYTPTNSYGVPVKLHHLDADRYYPYPPVPTIESNNVPQSSESRPNTHNQIVNGYNRGQSETLDHLPPVVYHPPYKKKNKKKKKKQQQQQQQQYPHQEFALQPESGKNSYPVTSYDAPLSFVPGGGGPSLSSAEKESNRYPVHPQKVRPAYNVGQSYVESYSRESSNEQEPPLLPAVYNQNDFKTVNKSNNKKKVVYQVNTSFEDFDDHEDHGLALEYPPSEEEEITEVPPFNFGARHKKKKRPHKFDFIDSYEDSSISQEVYHTTPFTVTRPFKRVPVPTITSTTRTYKIRSTTQDPLFDILDTEDLRTAYQSGRHRYKLAEAKKKNEQNFVLLSSKNPPRQSTKTPFLIHSGESGEVYNFPKSKPSSSSSLDRPPSSLESDYESYEIAERDFGLRKRDFDHKRKGASSRVDSSAEKIEFADSKRKDEFVKATTMKPYPRFNPDVHFTKTFSSKIEQPREASIWNGQAIPGNHKITKRGGSL